MSEYSDSDEDSIEWEKGSVSSIRSLPKATDDVDIWVDALIELAVDAMQSRLFAEMYKTSSEEPVESEELKKAAFLEFTTESDKFYKGYTRYLELYKNFHDLFFNDGTPDYLVKREAINFFGEHANVINIEVYEQDLVKCFEDKIAGLQQLQRTESLDSSSSSRSSDEPNQAKWAFFKKEVLDKSTDDQQKKNIPDIK